MRLLNYCDNILDWFRLTNVTRPTSLVTNYDFDAFSAGAGFYLVTLFSGKGRQSAFQIIRTAWRCGSVRLHDTQKCHVISYHVVRCQCGRRKFLNTCNETACCALYLACTVHSCCNVSNSCFILIVASIIINQYDLTQINASIAIFRRQLCVMNLESACKKCFPPQLFLHLINTLLKHCTQYGRTLL